MRTDRVHYRSTLRLTIPDQFLDLRRAEVGGHDDHGIAEVHRTPVAVSQASVFKHLQEDVEHVGMRLLDFVEQNQRIRFATYGFGQVAALFVTDVAWRRTDQASHGMFLHELGHVDTHHRLFGVEQELGQRLAQLGLAHAGRAEEHERSARTIRVGKPGTRTTHGIGDRDHRFFLADHPVVQQSFHAQQLVALAFEHLRHRDTGPLRHDLGNFFLGHLAAQQLVFRLAVLVDHLQAAFQVGNDPVLQLRHAVQIATAARGFQFLAGLFDFLLDLCRTGDLGFFRGPDFFKIRVLKLKALDFALELFQALDRRLVLFLLERLSFYFQLDQATLKAVEHFRLGVDLHANAAGRLVNQVDGLVRQLAVGDIAMAQFGRRDDRAVGDGDLVVHFVALFQATQDRNGVFFAWLVDQDFLESTLKRGILLYILAVLVERGSPHTMQLATRQRRFEHVASVHRAFALAGTNHGVQLVDEQNDLAFLLGQLVEQRLEALFELATVLGTGNQRAHVQRQQALAAQAIRHFAIDDALRQALGNGGLAHTRFADQHRVVLGAPLQDLNGATNLVITSDHRVELALFGTLGQVDGVLVQRLTRLFDVRVIHGTFAAQVVDGVFQGLLADALPQQQFAELAVLIHCREQHQLAGNELVAFLLRQTVSLVEQARQILRHVDVAGRVLDFWQAV